VWRRAPIGASQTRRFVAIFAPTVAVLNVHAETQWAPRVLRKMKISTVTPRGFP
jgi:hypothetical protein